MSPPPVDCYNTERFELERRDLRRKTARSRPNVNGFELREATALARNDREPRIQPFVLRHTFCWRTCGRQDKRHRFALQLDAYPVRYTKHNRSSPRPPKFRCVFPEILNAVSFCTRLND